MGAPKCKLGNRQELRRDPGRTATILGFYRNPPQESSPVQAYLLGGNIPGTAQVCLASWPPERGGSDRIVLVGEGSEPAASLTMGVGQC